MESTIHSGVEGRKHQRIDRYDREEDDSSLDPLENFRQERMHKRVIQDWE